MLSFVTLYIKGKEIKYKQSREELLSYSKTFKDDISASYIYAVVSPTFKEFIKIGRTSDLSKRIIQYNSSNPYSDFRYVATSKFILNTKEVERELISILGSSLVANEWFDIKDMIKIIDYISNIK